MAEVAKTYGGGPTRVQYQNKDPRGFQEFLEQLREHSTEGGANTLRGVQARRPSLYDLTAEMQRMRVPTLIMAGDEEEPCLEVCLLMKRCIPTAGLAILPMSGATGSDPFLPPSTRKPPWAKPWACRLPNRRWRRGAGRSIRAGAPGSERANR